MPVEASTRVGAGKFDKPPQELPDIVTRRQVPGPRPGAPVQDEYMLPVRLSSTRVIRLPHDFVTEIDLAWGVE